MTDFTQMPPMELPLACTWIVLVTSTLLDKQTTSCGELPLTAMFRCPPFFFPLTHVCAHQVSTLAGTGTAATVDGSLGTLAQFNGPVGLNLDTVTGFNRLIISESTGNSIRAFDMIYTVVSTLVGTGAVGATNGNSYTTATMKAPNSAAALQSGYGIISDTV